MSSQPPPDYIVPAQTAVTALIHASGNAHLAAERLGIPKHVLVASIAADPSAQRSLNEQLRTLALLTAFDTLQATQVCMDESISELEAPDRVKLFGDLVKLVTVMTESHETTANVNITETMLGALPPHVRLAVTRLMQEPAPPRLAAPLAAPTPAKTGDIDSSEEDAA